MGDVQRWPGAPRPGDPYANTWQPAVTPHSAMRAAHTDRDRTVDVLKAAYAEGRLSAEEYSARFDAANRAQTYGELGRIVSDLPAGPMVAPMGAPVPVMPAVPATFLPVQAPYDNLSAASLALGLLSVPTFGVLALPAVITGHLGRARVRRTGERGDGMALAGLWLGYAWLAGWSALLLMSVLLWSVG